MSGGRLEKAQKMANLVSAKTTKLYDRRDGEPTLAYGLGLLPGFLLMNGYWMAHLYARYRSPVLPLYNTVFKSPFRGDQDFSCLHLTADFGRTDHLHVPFSLYEKTTLLSEVPSRDVRLAAAL